MYYSRSLEGMLRATFSNSSKLNNVEMIFDSMGFCQQLERASGNEGMAQVNYGRGSRVFARF